MISIAIASGKGGAGKTSVSAALARYCGSRAIACDCDVDAANTAIALGTVVRSSEDYWSGDGYRVDGTLCNGCGACFEACRFGAIRDSSASFSIDEALCERCGACLDVCPSGAILAERKRGGTLFVSTAADGSLLAHAELIPGEDTSGKLVRAVRQRALKEAGKGVDFLVIDAPPGIGCPVIASLSGVDLAVVVIEAGISGIRDARRLFELLAGMKRRKVSVLNKTGIDAGMDFRARDLAAEFGSTVVSELPFDRRFRDSTERGEAWVDSSDAYLADISKKMCEGILGYQAIAPEPAETQ